MRIPTRLVRLIGVALWAILLIGFAVRGASAQNVWERVKQAAKQAEQQRRQPAPSSNPQGGRQQPNGRGQQQASRGSDESGPIHPPNGTRVEETVLAPLEQGARFFVSPHGIHVATLEGSGSRAVMYYDGVPGPKFDEILVGTTPSGDIEAVFSPDGKRYAYCGRQGDQMVVMVEGKEFLRTSESNMGRYNSSSCRLGFTSNSQHVYISIDVVTSMSRGGSYTRFIFDGKSAPPSASGQRASGDLATIRSISFSPDGNHYAFVLMDPADDNKWGLVIDGKVAPYRGGAPQWSADSQHLYTTIRTPAAGGRGEVTEAMLDGKPFLRADDLRLHVAPAGSMVVAEVDAATRTPQPIRFLVVDGKKVPGSEIVHLGGQQIDQVVISPDGKHFAARFTTPQGHQYVFLDGKRGQEYQTVDHIVFTSDSSKVTYSAFSNAKPYAIIGDQESGACLPEQVGPVINTHGALMTAPTGGRAGTICGLTGGTAMVYMDGKMSPLPSGAQGADDLRFSPDGKHYAYSATYGDMSRRLVLDGVEQANSNLGSPGNPRIRYVFSPDSQHIAADSVPPHPTGEYASGVFLDGKYIPVPANVGMLSLEFTADSKHIAWAQPVPSRHAFRIFVDGKAVAEADTAMATSPREGWWEMGPDGSLSILAQDENNLKRITITPSPETNLATMGGGGITVAQTGK